MLQQLLRIKILAKILAEVLFILHKILNFVF